MKRLVVSAIGLVTLTVTGCAISGYAIALLSSPPKEILQQGIPCSTETGVRAKNLQALSTHKWARGVVVLYSAACPRENPQSPLQRVLGHQVVKQDGMNWQVSGSSSFATETPTPDKAQLIDYGISKVRQPQGDRYTVLYGQVLSSKVTAVEATFDNGQTLRDVTSNGVFALVASAANRVCQVRVLGTDNQILQKQELAVPKPLRTGKRSQCLPVSRQL